MTSFRSIKQQRTFANIEQTSMETLLSCFPVSTTFLSTGATVPRERKLKGMKVVCGAKVPRVRKIHGTKVLGTFAPEERKFRRSESSMERKFLDFSLPGSECSTERKFHGSESSLYGLFAVIVYINTATPNSTNFDSKLFYYVFFNL